MGLGPLFVVSGALGREFSGKLGGRCAKLGQDGSKMGHDGVKMAILVSTLAALGPSWA